MGIGLKEIIIVLVIVLLLFGTKRLRNIGSDLGEAIRGFRKTVNPDDDHALAEQKDQHETLDVKPETQVSSVSSQSTEKKHI